MSGRTRLGLVAELGDFLIDGRFLGEEERDRLVARLNEAAGLRMFGHTACIGSAELDGTLAGIDT